MTKKNFNLTLLLAVFIFSSTSLIAQKSSPLPIKWEKEKIAKGIIWKHTHQIIEDTLLQNINMLVINTRVRDISLGYDPSKNVPTYEQAEAAGAIVAVNGGFFNVRDGGSVTYIRMNGEIVDSDTAARWKGNPNFNGAVMIDAAGKVSITKDMLNSWFDTHPEYQYVIVTGPLLIEDRSIAALPESSLVKTRHPRTSIGKRGKRKVILLTVDGRTPQSAGMTLHELADFMLEQKCTDAVNLDGGGSTTLWISGKPFDGVVNMPSDNKLFDHEGSRAVSNIILVR
jgi:exopolysaccharide biosynthesis protein